MAHRLPLIVARNMALVPITACSDGKEELGRDSAVARKNNEPIALQAPNETDKPNCTPFRKNNEPMVLQAPNVLVRRITGICSSRDSRGDSMTC